jgi:hypothetical protein
VFVVKYGSSCDEGIPHTIVVIADMHQGLFRHWPLLGHHMDELNMLVAGMVAIAKYQAHLAPELPDRQADLEKHMLMIKGNVMGQAESCGLLDALLNKRKFVAKFIAKAISDIQTVRMKGSVIEDDIDKRIERFHQDSKHFQAISHQTLSDSFVAYGRGKARQEQAEWMVRYHGAGGGSLAKGPSVPCPRGMTIGDPQWFAWVLAASKGASLFASAKSTGPATNKLKDHLATKARPAADAAWNQRAAAAEAEGKCVPYNPNLLFPHQAPPQASAPSASTTSSTTAASSATPRSRVSHWPPMTMTFDAAMMEILDPRLNTVVRQTAHKGFQLVICYQCGDSTLLT